MNKNVLLAILFVFLTTVIVVGVFRDRGRSVPPNVGFDSTSYYKDKYGRIVAYARSLDIEQDKIRALQASKNKEVADLAKQVHAYTQQISRLQLTLNGNYKVPTTIIDTLVKDTCGHAVKQWPVYAGIIKTKYDSLNIVAAKDSIKAAYSFKVPLTYKEEWKRRAPWLAPETVVSVYSDNPSAKLSNIQSIHIQPKRKRWHIGALGAYGVGLNGTIQPFVGVGVMYDFLSF